MSIGIVRVHQSDFDAYRDSPSTTKETVIRIVIVRVPLGRA